LVLKIAQKDTYVILLSRSVESAYRSSYRSANAIFDKVGRITLKETVLQLIKTKCIPLLLYGVGVCPLKQREIRSLYFVVNKFFTKLFQICDVNVVTLT